jgi:hypothetical protein
MAVIVPPTPVDGPSHMPFGAHRTPFAVAGVGPIGVSTARQWYCGLSSERAQCWRRARASRVTVTEVAGKEPVEGRLRSAGDGLQAGSHVRTPPTGMCRGIRYARAGPRPFLGSGGRTGPVRIRRPRRVWARICQGIVAIVGPADEKRPGNRLSTIGRRHWAKVRRMNVMRGRCSERMHRQHGRNKPLKGKPHGCHRHETRPERFREEESAKRLRKPAGAA